MGLAWFNAAVHFIAVIAWPALVAWLCYFFRKQLRDLIDRTRELHWPGGSAEFDELKEQAKRGVDAIEQPHDFREIRRGDVPDLSVDAQRDDRDGSVADAAVDAVSESRPIRQRTDSLTTDLRILVNLGWSDLVRLCAVDANFAVHQAGLRLAQAIGKAYLEFGLSVGPLDHYSMTFGLEEHGLINHDMSEAAVKLLAAFYRFDGSTAKVDSDVGRQYIEVVSSVAQALDRL